MISIILILPLHVVRDAVILHHFCEELLKFASVNRKHFAGVLFGKVLYCHVVTIPHTSDKSKSFLFLFTVVTRWHSTSYERGAGRWP